MVRYTKESLENLRSRIDLVDLLSQHIDLKKAGATYKALCPFHDERSPSFVVNRGSNHYHCFGCGAHGDAIHFLMQHLKMSFQDAVVHLAERFQVQLEEIQGTGTEQKVSNKARLKEVQDLACRFYQCVLLESEEGKEALEYLFKRGLTLDFITTFRIGLAPKAEGYLRRLAYDGGFSDDVLVDAGLLVERHGKLREFFQERILFPILDPAGSVIGFSGRKYKEETYGGKYINTSETALFKKSKILFGLYHSRKRIVKDKQALIVEGQLDALRLIWNGFDQTVAALGTAFGEGHVHELVHLGVSRVFLLLDGDDAGQAATVKIGHMFQKQGIEVLVAPMPKGQDPDSLLLKEGPLAIVESLIHAEEYLTFLFTHSSKGVRLDSPAEKNQFLQEIVQRIRDWNNPIMVHESLKKLAHLAKVPEDLLGVGAVQHSHVYMKKNIQASTIAPVDPDRVLEIDLLRWMIVAKDQQSQVISIIKENLQEKDFRITINQKIFTFLLHAIQAQIPIDLLSLASEIDDEEIGTVISEIVSKKINHERAKEHVIETIRKIKERNWMLEREWIKMKIHSNTTSDEEAMELVRKFDELKKNTPQVIIPNS